MLTKGKVNQLPGGVIPEEFHLIEMARHLMCPPWELLSQPYIWRIWAAIHKQARALIDQGIQKEPF